MSLTKLTLGGNNDVIYKLFPPRESLVSDIPAGDGKIVNLFYSVYTVHECATIAIRDIYRLGITHDPLLFSVAHGIF